MLCSEGGKDLMTLNHALPDDPLKFIQRCTSQRKILWTYRVNIRLKGRFISRQVLLDSYECFEVIEQYPEDKYLPSYLVRSQHQGDVFHIIFAVDVEGDNIRIVTAYRPNSEEWEDGFRIRGRSS